MVGWSNNRMVTLSNLFHNNVLVVAAGSPPPVPDFSVYSSFNQLPLFSSSKFSTCPLSTPLPSKTTACKVSYWPSRFDTGGRIGRSGCGSVVMDSSPRKILKTSYHLRHVESMKILPSGAGNISRLNAVILGESLASEENDLVFPSEEFSGQALVSSPEKVPRLLSFVLPTLFIIFLFL